MKGLQVDRVVLTSRQAVLLFYIAVCVSKNYNESQWYVLTNKENRQSHV